MILLFIIFVESAAPTTSNDNTLPVVIETTEDASINNLTRNDANCDKTGTCYDGNISF